MINQQCAAKRFDAVETDLDETYSGSDGTTGFTETKADEEAYMTTLADYMHSLGLAWVIKNPDDTGDSYAADMEPLADLDLSEQCNQYGTCSALTVPRSQAGFECRVCARDDVGVLCVGHQGRDHG